jgi:hypothetical protein
VITSNVAADLSRGDAAGVERARRCGGGRDMELLPARRCGGERARGGGIWSSDDAKMRRRARPRGQDLELWRGAEMRRRAHPRGRDLDLRWHEDAAVSAPKGARSGALVQRGDAAVATTSKGGGGDLDLREGEMRRWRACPWGGIWRRGDAVVATARKWSGLRGGDRLRPWRRGYAVGWVCSRQWRRHMCVGHFAVVRTPAYVIICCVAHSPPATN